MVFKFLVIVCAFLVWGGQEYPVPPSVCLLGCGFFSLSLFMLALGRARPAPSSHCGLYKLILCAGTRDPLMHRWVARTIVMATLLVTYPHVCE